MFLLFNPHWQDWFVTIRLADIDGGEMLHWAKIEGTKSKNERKRNKLGLSSAKLSAQLASPARLIHLCPSLYLYPSWGKLRPPLAYIKLSSYSPIVGRGGGWVGQESENNF